MPRPNPRCNPDRIIYPRIENTAGDDGYPALEMSRHARARAVQMRMRRQMGLRALSTSVSALSSFPMT